MLEAMDEDVMKRPPDNINELEIKVTRCLKISARREGIMNTTPIKVRIRTDFIIKQALNI